MLADLLVTIDRSRATTSHVAAAMAEVKTEPAPQRGAVGGPTEWPPPTCAGQVLNVGGVGGTEVVAVDGVLYQSLPGSPDCQLVAAGQDLDLAALAAIEVDE